MDWLQFLNGVTVVGLPALVVVIAGVAFLRQIGMPSSFAGVAAAVFGLLTALAIQAIKAWPSVEPWVTVVVIGMLLGLAGNGAYSQYRHLIETREKDARAAELEKMSDGGGGGT